MRSILPNFPAGRVGAGLLLLRLSAAMSILVMPVLTAAVARPWGVTLLATGLIIGLWTRMVAVLYLALLVLPLLSGAPPSAAGAQLLEATAILLLGAGAYSADAMLFGRRTIILGRASD